MLILNKYKCSNTIHQNEKWKKKYKYHVYELQGAIKLKKEKKRERDQKKKKRPNVIEILKMKDKNNIVWEKIKKLKYNKEN